MRIKVINPNMTQHMTDSIRICAEKYASPGTDIICESARFGVPSIECFTDTAFAQPAVLESIIRGDREQDIDAYVIACFDDPGLAAAREITTRPVVGIAHAAMITASLVSPSFSIVTVLDRSRIMNLELAERYGYGRMLRSVRSTGLGVLEFEKDLKRGMQALAKQAEIAVSQDGAESILLGCAGFVDFADGLRKQLGVPVIDGVMPAVKYAEALVLMNLSTSKLRSWGPPEEKEYIGFLGIR